MERIKAFDYLRLIKYVLGSVLAIFFAGLLRLDFAYAAGIITLLTIQDSKKETLLVTVKRLVVFVVMTVLSLVIFGGMGYTLLAFGILLVPYLCFCMVLNMKEAIAPIAVLCTHYISAGSVDIHMVYNEFMILLIGAGVGVLLNLFFFDRTYRLKEYQAKADEKIVHIIRRMAVYIEKDDKSDYKGDCFGSLEEVLDSLKKESILYHNNRLIGENDYYYNYMQMRLRQCNLLKHIYSDIIRIGETPWQAGPLAFFLKQLADEFGEENDGAELLARLSELEEYYRELPLPESRAEFEARAILYHILKDLQLLVEIKASFLETV